MNTLAMTNRSEKNPSAAKNVTPLAMEARCLPRCHEGWRVGRRGDSPVGHVMAWGSPRSSSSLRSLAAHLFLTIVVVAMTVNCVASSKAGPCKVDACSRLYEEAMEKKGISGPEPSAAFCHVLRDYGTCIRATARTCRGNLGYHSTSSLVSHMMNGAYNCSQLLADFAAGRTPRPSSRATLPPEPPQPSPTPPVRHPHHKQCTFQGRHKFRHCGLFGDPHLKTFSNEYQTCRVRGAWPLIDNPYLAVQVTNEPVVDGSPATATTKVTILVRGGETPCTTDKTYEAQVDGPLPTLFIDGTQRSGPDESVTLTVHEQASRIDIYIRYIETTLTVRQVGRYLAFSARMPEEIVHTRAFGSDQDFAQDSLQLCVRGCPPSERLDPVASRGQALPWEEAVARCRKTDGYSNDINYNLTDHYLDWCVFDVMTTGDGEAAGDFTAAAHSAQADVLRLDPASLRNRTTTVEFPYVPSSATAMIPKLDPSRIITLLLLIFVTIRRV